MVRFNLPDIEFVSSDPIEIEARMVTRVEEKMGVTLSNADPRRKFIQAIAEILSVHRNQIDYSAKQNLLAYAQDDFLDHIGETRGTTRNEPRKAETTIKITIIPSNEDLVVPNGTSFFAVDDIYFETIEDFIIPAGESFIEVEAFCTEEGDKGNGFLPGQITVLVDPLPWVQSIKNITTSEGGVDWEESDPYAERIRQAPEGFSTAGPTGAYIYWAKTANQLIIDVNVYSPSDGVVEIRPLLKEGEVPGEEILQSVKDVFNNREIRPITDHVNVLAPEQVSYNVDLTYWVHQSDSSILGSIQSQVESAVQDYILWQKSKLGRSIDPSELITKVKMAGAKRVALTSPQYLDIEDFQVAIENITTVNFGGMEDD